MTPVSDIQRALLEHGFDPGPIDGVAARMTLAALRAFQLSRGLQPDGIVGPATAAELFGRPPPVLPIAAPPWHQIAAGLEGTREIAGPRHSPAIMRWAARLGLHYAGDETAWCGLFAAHCLASALPDEPLPNNPLAARNFLRFGRPLAQPAIGAVLVFRRGDPRGWTGHVGFCCGEDGVTYAVLGGNQSNSVSVAHIAKQRCLGLRWPRTAPPPATGAMDVSSAAAPSTNEA